MFDELGDIDISEDVIEEEVAPSQWEETDEGLTKNFSFDNFPQAIDFVNSVARLAEDQQHHPNILLHSWNQVKITSITHEEDAVTDKDWDLVDAIDALQNDEQFE